MINLNEKLGIPAEGLQAFLDNCILNIKEHIIENYVQEPMQIVRGVNANKLGIYSFDTEGTKVLQDDGTIKNITYATMHMNLEDNTNTCYMYRRFEDFIKCFENNDEHKSIFYAHNGSGYDYKNILYPFQKLGYEILENKIEKSYYGLYQVADKLKRKQDDMTKTIEIIYKDGKIYSIECVVKTVYVISERHGKNWIYHELSYEEAKTKYEDLKKIEKYRVDKKLIFKDSMLLLAGSLENLCKDSLNLKLPKEDLDYWIYRDSNTKLTDREYFYCYADVFGLKYLVKEVINKSYHFNYLSYNKNSECFIYDTNEVENLYNSLILHKMYDNYTKTVVDTKDIIEKNDITGEDELKEKLIYDSITGEYVNINNFDGTDRLTNPVTKTTNGTIYLEVKTPDVYDRFNISNLDIALSSKLTSASYSFTILKWFVHYEVCKTLYYLLNNPSEIKTEFQKYLIDVYKKDYEKRCLKLKKGEQLKFTVNESFRLLFPVLDRIVDSNNRISATWFIKHSYHGGRCFTGRNFYSMYHDGNYNTYYRGNGTVIDANSLYPSQMKLKPMPYGYYDVVDNAEFVNHIDYYLNKRISFIKFTVDDRVTLKQDKFPMQRVTNNICEGFNGNEAFISNVKRYNGVDVPVTMKLTLNSIDYKNFIDSYNVPRVNLCKVLSFKKTKGIFDSFIDYFYDIKRNSKGSDRANAKLILNSSYGKMGLKPTSRDYDIYLGDDGVMHYDKKYVVPDSEGNTSILSKRFLPDNISELEELVLTEEPNYMPVASVICAEGRAELKRVSEVLGIENFLYGDTDSAHVMLTKEQITGKLGELIHDKDIGCWAVEGQFTEGIYLGSKRYAEFIKFTKSEKKLDNFVLGYWDVKCCGIPSKVQKKIAKNITTFDYCKYSPKEFKQLLKSDKLIIVNDIGEFDNKNGYLYKNIDTGEIIKGAYVVNKSKEGIDGVCVTQQPYLITSDLYLFGSDID